MGRFQLDDDDVERGRAHIAVIRDRLAQRGRGTSDIAATAVIAQHNDVSPTVESGDLIEQLATRCAELENSIAVTKQDLRREHERLNSLESQLHALRSEINALDNPATDSVVG